jgi:hypothetical protein
VLVAERELERYRELTSGGSSRAQAMGGIGLVAAGVVADDASVIGVADDVLLPFLALAALVTVMVTRPAAYRVRAGLE